MPLVKRTSRSQIISTSKQKHSIVKQEEEKIARISERIRESTTMKKPQIMGGGSIEHSGDGTGFAGGVDLGYWASVKLRQLEIWLNRKPVEGVDYPSGEQMEKAKMFTKARSKES